MSIQREGDSIQRGKKINFWEKLLDIGPLTNWLHTLFQGYFPAKSESQHLCLASECCTTHTDKATDIKLHRGEHKLFHLWQWIQRPIGATINTTTLCVKPRCQRHLWMSICKSTFNYWYVQGTIHTCICVHVFFHLILASVSALWNFWIS